MYIGKRVNKFDHFWSSCPEFRKTIYLAYRTNVTEKLIFSASNISQYLEVIKEYDSKLTGREICCFLLGMVFPSFYVGYDPFNFLGREFGLRGDWLSFFLASEPVVQEKIYSRMPSEVQEKIYARMPNERKKVISFDWYFQKDIVLGFLGQKFRN